MRVTNDWLIFLFLFSRARRESAGIAAAAGAAPRARDDSAHSAFRARTQPGHRPPRVAIHNSRTHNARQRQAKY